MQAFAAWCRKHFEYVDLDAFEMEIAWDAYQAGRAATLSQATEAFPCRIVEADFETGTVTLEMHGKYTVSSGQKYLCDAPLQSQDREGRRQWISVEDRLPNTDEIVLVLVPGARYQQVALDCWRMQREAPLSWSSATIEIGMGWDDHEFDEVTHWMPIPTPPADAQRAKGE